MRTACTSSSLMWPRAWATLAAKRTAAAAFGSFEVPLRLAAISASSSFARFLPRSEEHTSELQSLMRISYADFCLNKKKRNIYITGHHEDHNREQHSQKPTT